MAILIRLVCDERAQDMAEYGIALAVIGLVAALAAFAIAQNVGSLWSKANSLVSSAVQ
jgi:Flp pilus assembly pilin Flp